MSREETLNKYLQAMSDERFGDAVKVNLLFFIIVNNCKSLF